MLAGKNGLDIWSPKGTSDNPPFSRFTAIDDLDGDKRPEIAGVSYRREKPEAFSVAVISSRDGARVWAVEEAASGRLAEDIRRCPDANGDGLTDLVLRAPGVNVDGIEGRGRLRILSGKDGKTITLINPLDTK